jgi:hypothetical protein
MEFEQPSRSGHKAQWDGMYASSADSVVIWGMKAYHSLAGLHGLHSDDGDIHSGTVDDTSNALEEGTLPTGCESDRQAASRQL